MFVIPSKDYAELSRHCAGIVAAGIRKRPDLRLGPATGSTPLGMRRELARMHRDDNLDF